MVNQFRQGQLIYDLSSNRKGKFMGYNRDMGKTARVEFIVKYDEETGQRTTELKTVNVSDLRVYEDKRKKQLHKDTLLFAKLRPDAIIPSKELENGGYDIYANFEEDEIVIQPNEMRLIPTGIASSMSPKYVLLVRERGSTGTKCMSVRAGVIDSGYRNEIFIPINNTGNKKIVITKHDVVKQDDNVIYYPYSKAIAQLLLLPVPNVEVKEIPYEELKAIPSKRGMGALGSSGK